MADFTQNITNAVRCFGPADSTKWGQANFAFTMTWGTSTWGEGGVLVTQFVKVISESQALACEVTSKQASKNFEIASLVATFDADFESLGSGNWLYVFTSNTEDADARSIASWTSSALPDATFTCQAAAGTAWSEA